jgi:glycosyltransferase involved in cell wall biosynthesis
MSTNEPLVSIVTPVYNESAYLPECIESVLNQTYTNWEYVIVDNCSKDGSAEIARRYAAKDSRIRVVSNDQFLRAIPNHNHALRQISVDSKYCKIVLGDDWIYPECLERMVAVAESNSRVGLVGAYLLEGTAVKCTGLSHDAHVSNGSWICREHFLHSLYVFGSANSVLYRSDLVRARSSFFNENNIHADTEVCFELLKDSDFGFVHQVLTFTRLRPKSLATISADLNTCSPGMLHTLREYGPIYLTDEEQTRLWNQRVTEYHEFLAKSLLKGRDDKFWTFHKTKLSELGVQISRLRLFTTLLKLGCISLLNPLSTSQRLFGAWSRSRSSSQSGAVLRPVNAANSGSKGTA